MELKDKEYFFSVAELVAGKSTCLKKAYGVVIVKNGVVVSTGSNVAPEGCQSCKERGICHFKVTDPKNLDKPMTCRSLHPEVDAIVKVGASVVKDATMFIVALNLEKINKKTKKPEYVKSYTPCPFCQRVMLASGLKNIWYYKRRNNGEIKLDMYRVENFASMLW
jgi:Deoxycytidylate deaminase